MSLILLIEDNEQILHGNERMFRRRGYDVAVAPTLREARERLRGAAPDAIVLDIMLPDGSGLDFLKELRMENGEWRMKNNSPFSTLHSPFSNTPVLLLTGLTAPDDIVRGLSEGGDDYLAKPYDFGVLLARVEALLRRTGRFPASVQKGPLQLDLLSGRALMRDEDLLLTRKDFALLLLFTQNEGQAMSAEYLYEKLWKTPMAGDTQAVKSAVSRLRKKLAGSGYGISSRRGEGYLFERE